VNPVFLDTGFIIALESADDQHHRAAKQYWSDFGNDPAPLVTTSYVFDEVVTFFNNRGHHAKAVETGRYLLDSPSLQVVHVDQELLQDGWRIFVRNDDKRYSLTDCISFVVMKRFRLKIALTFDKHFSQAGFERKP